MAGESSPLALAPVEPDPMTPRLFRVGKRRRELSDTFTLELEAAEPGAVAAPFSPGQFNMLYAFGVGEVPISISGDPGVPGRFVHTVRAVGPVTDALRGLRRGDTLGVRGPFGTAWPVAEAEGADVVVLAGGVGLAPLRPAIHALLARRERYGRVCIFYGARTPEDILFRKQLERWRGRFDLSVEVIVDRATGSWSGPVGVVTRLLTRGGFDPTATVALLCGPEVMMRYAIGTLNGLQVPFDRIYVSMERNMKCAVGLCGHCQFGASFVCRDGPVFRFDRISGAFETREI